MSIKEKKNRLSIFKTLIRSLEFFDLRRNGRKLLLLIKMLKPCQRILSTPTILQIPSFGLRVRVPREINYSFENERKQYKVQMKEYRKVHFKEFWDTQTQAENLYLERFKKERI